MMAKKCEFIDRKCPNMETQDNTCLLKNPYDCPEMKDPKLTPEGKKAIKFRIFHEPSVSKDLNEMLDKLQNETARAQLAKAKPIIEKQERERIYKEIEKKSHPMNTNMYGISLSRDEWQALKGEK